MGQAAAPWRRSGAGTRRADPVQGPVGDHPVRGPVAAARCGAVPAVSRETMPCEPMLSFKAEG